MDKDKFTNIYRLPGSIQIRIGKWQKTFRGTSDLVLHQALMERNKQFKKPDFLPKGWCVTPVDENDITITHHGKYIQTVMRTMLDRKVSYKRLFLSRMSLEDGEKVLHNYKLEWVRKHNQIAKKYNQIKKKQYMNFAREEEETLYLRFQRVSLTKHYGTNLSYHRLVRRKSTKTRTLSVKPISK